MRGKMKVSKLKTLNFNSLPMAEKVKIKNDERPIPELVIIQEVPKSKTRAGFTRRFDKNAYKKTLWLCGCEERNAFFCFICLLFGGNDDWTRQGVRDLKHLNTKIRKHEKSIRHMNNALSFQLLGVINIASSLSNAYAENICLHNEMVTRNRYALSKTIDILKLCGKCNLALRGQDESDQSPNKGMFLELIDYTRNVDSTLHMHLQSSTAFKGTSKTIQNELLDYMLQICRDQILNEVKEASFLALMVDDITDVYSCTQTVLVFRYFLNGKIHQRFWGFANTKSDSADGLSASILEQIDPILKDSSNKLIAQTYGGTAVMWNINAKIKEVYKNAHYIYNYAHQFKELLEQALSAIPSIHIFFGNINAISAFFSSSPNRMEALNRVSDEGNERSSQTRWSFQSKTIETIFENRDKIVECFENIESGIPRIYNNETTLQAAGFIHWFNDHSFQFWLGFFYKLMLNVDVLFNQLQKITDPVKLQCAIDSFEKMVLYLKNNLPAATEDVQVAKKRKRNEEDLNSLAREVCDTVIFQINDRFNFKNHLSGAKLFRRANYVLYRKNLPLNDIDNFCEAFPTIDKPALKVELSVFYSRPEITNQSNNVSGCLQLLNLITSYDLDSIFCEISKILKILVTMPMITAETERCFSSLKHIKTYLRSAMVEEKLTALAMLSIEKTLVAEIPDFNEKVIEKFIADKDKRMEFHFKN